MRLSFFVVGVIIFLIWAVVRVASYISFDINCEGHLKRAADANTVELAKQEMETVVIEYLEKNNMTTGYTSILWNTPDEDIDFWYRNLKSSLQELNNISPEATQLEKTNVLMKLRETLLDQGQSTTVTAPMGISIFPHNALFVFLFFISVILMVVPVVIEINE